jgi:hypothetical protein
MTETPTQVRTLGIVCPICGRPVELRWLKTRAVYRGSCRYEGTRYTAEPITSRTP